MKRARSAVTGRIVKLATARRWPKRTVVEDVATRMRVDDRRPVRVEVRPLGEVRAGDTIVATIRGDRVLLGELEHVRAELKRWVAIHAPGAEVLATAGDVELTVSRTGRLADVEVLLVELEALVARQYPRLESITRAELEGHADALGHGITALRMILSGDPDHAADELEAVLAAGGDPVDSLEGLPARSLGIAPRAPEDAGA